MEIRQLKTFRSLATTLSFTRTALLLDYAQSSVTAQVQALEEELGVLLLDRMGRRVALTEAGQRLVGYADKIIELSEEAHTALSSSQQPTGTITLSAPETLCTYRLPGVLSRFRACYPQVRLIFRPYPVDEFQRGVADGKLDLAFLLDEPIQSTSMQVESLIEEEIVVVAPADHPLALAGPISPADLEGEAFLLTEAACSYRNLFRRRLALAGVGLTTSLDFNSVEAIKQCVIAGMGITVLPAVAVTNEVQQGKLTILPWAEPPVTMFTQLIWHKDKWLSPALEAFLDTARQELGSEVRGNGSC